MVNGKNWDEPEFLPLFQAAESMGAVLFFHPQPQDNLAVDHAPKYMMPNSVGVIVEDTLITATMIFWGHTGEIPGSEGMHRSRRGPGLLWYGPTGPGLAGALRGENQHQPASQHLPAANLLGLHHHERGCPPLSHRFRRHRPRRAGQRLALCPIGILRQRDGFRA